MPILKVTWKVLVFLSVVSTLLFLVELMAMWLMVGLDGVFAVFSRRSQSLTDVTFQVATLAIGLLWLLQKMSKFGGVQSESPYSTHLINPSSGYSRAQSTWKVEDDDFMESGSDNVVAANSHINDVDSDSTTQHLVNVANGLPMVGNVDVEGNVFGTDAFWEPACGFDDDFTIGCSDSFLDDGGSGLSDDSWA